MRVVGLRQRVVLLRRSDAAQGARSDDDMTDPRDECSGGEREAVDLERLGAYSTSSSFRALIG
jgi:hypothetical protein